MALIVVIKPLKSCIVQNDGTEIKKLFLCVEMQEKLIVTKNPINKGKEIMSLFQKRQIDNKFRRIVFQYIREHEQENEPLNVPSMIKYLCFQYYLIQEFFVGFPKTTMTIKGSDTEYHKEREFMGNDKIIDLYDTSISKYIWTLRILSLPPENLSYWQGAYMCVDIGWTTTKHSQINENFKAIKKVIRKRICYGRERMDYYKVGDIIKLVLDAATPCLSWSCNGESMGVLKPWGADRDREQNAALFKKWGYALSLTLPYKFSVKLTSFEIIQN